MDIDKNDIQILANRIPKILIESSSALLKRNPKASFAWFSIFVSYIFFPRILWFSIYTVPFIVLITAISIKTYVIVRKESDAKKHEEAKDGKSPRKVQSAEDESDDNRTYNAKHARSVRRRKSKVTFPEIGQDNIQEKQAICSTNFTHDLIDKKALLEDMIKDIREVEVSVVNDHVESSQSGVSLDFQSRFNLIMRSQAFADLNTDGVSSENIDDQGDATREERTDNRGVEDDQENIADLGLSEIERNKRLESLIARRRAKNILSLPIRRAMMNMGHNDSHGQHIYPIVIQKSNPTSPRSDQFIPGPISAPSRSSNIRNPFDLPYEPHEERPNLTSDGFHQEFFGSHPKDTMLCRHESSSLGGTPPGNLRHNLPRTPLPNKHGKKKEIVRRKEKAECQSGESNEEKKVEKEQSQSQSHEVECDDKVENTDQGIEGRVSTQEPDLDSVSHEDLQNKVTTKPVIVEGCNRLSLSSSSDEDEPISRLDKEMILKSLSSPRPTNMYILRGGGRFHDILLDYGSPETEKTERTEHFDYPDHNNHHIRSHSIASDMQVEVSEIGSTPDMNISSPDEVRSLSDGKFEKEISDSEDMWTSSSQLSGVNENESRSRKIHEVGDKDTVGVGFSTIKECKIPIERVIAQDSSNPRPNFVSDSNIPGDTDANKDFTEHIIPEQPNTSCPNSSHAMKPKVLQSHEEQQLTGTSMTDHFCDSDLRNPQVPSSPPGTPTEELNINLSCSNLEGQNIDDDVRSIQNLENECKSAHSHELDEVTDSTRSQEKLRENVEHPLESEIHNKDTSEDVIKNEDAGKNVDGNSLFSHNTVNNGIHGEMQNSESGSRLHLLLSGEAQSLQPDNPYSNSDKSNESGSTLEIIDLLDLQNSSKENLITDEEVGNKVTREQGRGVLEVLGEAQLEEHHRPARLDEATGESSQPSSTREVEEMSEEMPQQMEMPQSMSTEGNYILVSAPDTEDEASSIAIVTSETNQFVIQPNEVLSVLEIETEQVPTALSTSSSPKSVLAPRLPGDQGSVSNLSDDIQMANQHSGGESSGSNSSSPPPQTAAPPSEDLTTYQSRERIPEPSTSRLVPAEEATSASGCSNTHVIDTNSMDHGQKQTSEASSSYTNTENQETNLDTLSSNKEETDQSNPSTSCSSELEKG